MKHLGDGTNGGSMLPVPIGTITVRTARGDESTVALEAYGGAIEDCVLVVVRQERGIMRKTDVMQCLERIGTLKKRNVPVLHLQQGQTIEFIPERRLVEAGWCRKETADFLGGATAEDAYKQGFAAGFRRGQRSRTGAGDAASELLLASGDVAESADPSVLRLEAGESIMDAYKTPTVDADFEIEP